MTDDLTAEALLESTAAAYRGFTEYEDAGSVTEGDATLVRFATQFRRGSVFRFSGSKDGVMVTVVGANHDGDDTLVYVQWCCSMGLGTFRLKRVAGVWSLGATEGWLQT